MNKNIYKAEIFGSNYIYVNCLGKRGMSKCGMSKRNWCMKENMFCSFRFKINDYNKIKENKNKWISMNLQSSNDISSKVAQYLLNETIEFI